MEDIFFTMISWSPSNRVYDKFGKEQCSDEMLNEEVNITVENGKYSLEGWVVLLPPHKEESRTHLGNPNGLPDLK